ncbi:hypothetical protein VPNG_00384 [Cytospora leucostoma]|uniref:DUF7707 domain-containing protein n=1 Tax=Cytospora leucostoma TaxID=1230097 RepID=A0A423XNU2_9PEZI|nr:hypothetical protein VPNG_00384 [Cytospora leucostoma]
MRSFIAVAALSALLVAADNSTFSIDPSEVKLTTRASWCQGQTSTCSILCDTNPVDNSCDVNTLDFSCTCTNGSAPGLQYYTQTIDTFVCQQAFQDCITANVGDATGQENCTTTIQDNCGTLDPSNYTATTTTTSSSAAASTAAATSAATGSSSSTVASTTSSQAAAAATNLQHIGTGALAVGMGALAYLL